MNAVANPSRPLIWRKQTISPITLGTVQLGMNYGIANRTGKPSANEAKQIIRTAWEHGVRFFDTAQAYGQSEIVLGRVLKDLGFATEAKIVSKLHPALNLTNETEVYDSICESIKKLGGDRLWGMMLHHSDMLDSWDQGLGDALLRARSEGLVSWIGVSAYDTIVARRALSSEDIDIVQLPYNLFDHRLLSEGLFNLALKNDKLLFLRSVFLQGLVFLAPNELPSNLSFARKYHGKLYTLLTETGFSPAQLALGFAKATGNGFPLVVGADSGEQINQTIDAFNSVELDDNTVASICKNLANAPKQLIDPSQWRN